MPKQDGPKEIIQFCLSELEKAREKIPQNETRFLILNKVIKEISHSVTKLEGCF